MQEYLGSSIIMKNVRILGQAVHLSLVYVIKETSILNILIGMFLLYTIPAVAALLRKS